jgi:hypothetical protein
MAHRDVGRHRRAEALRRSVSGAAKIPTLCAPIAQMRAGAPYLGQRLSFDRRRDRNAPNRADRPLVLFCTVQLQYVEEETLTIAFISVLSSTLRAAKSR